MLSVYSVQFVLISKPDVQKSKTLNNGTLVRRTYEYQRTRIVCVNTLECHYN